uniref:PHD-type domain-containing protein n=1 Tax=Populus davidiana TaxID=266767 RepID=A0A6M2ERN9_9ROSI
MKRELGFVSSLGRPTQSSSSCSQLSDNDRSKRIKVTKVNGFIVYTRVRKTKNNNVLIAAEDDERHINRIKSLDDSKIDVANTINASISDDGFKCLEVNNKTAIGERNNCNNVGKGVCKDESKGSLAVKGGKVMNLAVFGENGEVKSNDRPKRVRKSKLKIKLQPVEVTVKGPEVIEGEALSRVDVEMIAEGSALTPPKKNLELKMSKKIALENVPMTVKELFETGLLEGVPVVYMGGKKFQAFGLRGTIKDVGILCSCAFCNGHRVIPPSQFEIHAIKQYRRAAQYICFENGKSLLDVLNACRTAPLDSLETTIQSAISGLPVERTFTCKRCKGTFPSICVGKIGPLCNLCAESKDSHPTLTFGSSIISSSSEQVLALEYFKPASLSTSSQDNTPRKKKRKSSKTNLNKSAPARVSSRIQSKITPKPEEQDSITKPSKSASVYLSSRKRKYKKISPRISKSVLMSKCFKNTSVGISSQNQWKITTKDQRLHRLVFEEGGLPDGTELAYYARGQKLLGGYKRGFGILCRCCNCEVSPSMFEAHAGWATRKKPYAYIYTSNGVSLHELAISLSKSRKYSSRDNDDLCIICADGGNLLLCDGCPRAFHKGCASLPTVPSGDWYCQYCQNTFEREKLVEHNANASAAGRVSGVDSIEQITKRCFRIVKNIEAELTGCALCRGYDFMRSGFGPRTIILCDQCEKEFHVGCLRSHKMTNLKELPKGNWFCCMDCSRIHSTLQKLLIRGAEKLPDSLLNDIKKKHEEKGLNISNNIDVRWTLLSGKIASPENKLLLSRALSIFQECFDPIVDSTIGRDLIPLMVYGKNSKGQDYGGMYCAVLTINSSIVSAGILRVFGEEVAELPLVATRNGEHGKGYFQLLFSCIEKLLAFLNVQNLVLPAAEEAESIWTEKFGFQKIKPEQLNKYRKSCCQMVRFEGTSMLQKAVPTCRIVNQRTSP